MCDMCLCDACDPCLHLCDACLRAQFNGRVTPVVGGATGSDPPCHHLRHSGPPSCLVDHCEILRRNWDTNWDDWVDKKYCIEANRSYQEPCRLAECWTYRRHIVCGHTWYLSRVPRACSCKFFLAGVNFCRFNAKNWQFTVYFAVITQKIGNLLCILS